MKFLIYGLNFHPELVGIGKYTGEMARELAKRGHQVRVVTAPPYYPQWKVGEGYSANRYSVEEKERLKVMRCPLWVPKKVTGLTRVLHLLSFAFFSAPVVFWEARQRPDGTKPDKSKPDRSKFDRSKADRSKFDLIFAVAPAIAAAPVAAIAGRLMGIPTWLHIQDFEFQAALNLGIIGMGNHGLGMRLINNIERAIYKRFDRVSSISEKMVERLRSKGVPVQKALYLPNWVDLEEIHPLEGVSSYRQALGIGKESVVALYSGSMGAKQGLEVLVEAARVLMDERQVQFVICGEGPAREELEQAAGGLDNVHFLPLQPAERLNKLLNLADMHLLPQRADAADLVMPSKMLGILASGRPVIAGCYPGTALYDAACETGLAIEPENSGALVVAIRNLTRGSQLRKELGERGRTYAEEHFSKDKVMDRFLIDAKNCIAE
jgi:colanic acid biosynthesis glycosyl transferase WcaI